MADNEFEDVYQKAEKLYTDGKYEKAVPVAEEAVKTATDFLVKALRKEAWSAKHAGHKNAEIRDKMYEIALACAKEILKMSKDIEARNSAIKLLILLPGIDIEPLCNMGIRELDGSDLDYQEKENLKAELMNSLGIEIRKTEPLRAIAIFIKSYETVEKGTTTAGHLMHNAGTCRLMMKNKASVWLKEEDAVIAIEYLQVALQNYPVDQKGHREAVEQKIANTRKEIENNFQ